MISVGKSLNLRIVAEGIETKLQLDFLRRHGCDDGQGYYFSQPLPADDAAKILKEGMGEQLVQ
jgi:EAL domain-containing protein (putative c-di-GMP-specific phosphodiesterase class I)